MFSVKIEVYYSCKDCVGYYFFIFIYAMPKQTHNIVSDNVQYSKLYKCNSVTKLAELLETTEEFLQEFDYQEFSNIILGKHYNIYPTKKDNGSIRYIEEPTIYRYYFEDYTITKDNQPTTIKKGEVQKYDKGKWELLSLNKEEYSLLYQQSERKKTARKMGLRGKFFNRARYVEIGLKEVQRVICEHLQFGILDFNKGQWWLYKNPSYLHSGIKHRSTKTQAQYLSDQVSTHWDLYDIEKFYQNVLYKHIFDFFHKKMNCNRRVARILANLSSFDGTFYVAYKKLEGKELKAMVQTKHILTGSPLSQCLAFLCFKETFDKIHDICLKNNGKLAVYVDDITITNATKALKKDVIELLAKDGLTINNEKIIYLPKKADKENLGIRHTDSGLSPTKKFIKNNIKNREELNTENSKHLLTKSSRKLHKLKKDSTSKAQIDLINKAQTVKGQYCYTKYVSQ